jgi:hypothetical protein
MALEEEGEVKEEVEFVVASETEKEEAVSKAKEDASKVKEMDSVEIDHKLRSFIQGLSNKTTTPKTGSSQK